MPAQTPVSFMMRVVKDTSGCWLWSGYRDRNGYGRCQLLGKSTTAHRVAWTLLVGPIPEGLEIDHLCRVRPCVNPDHLEPVTREENVRRVVAANTHCSHGHEYTEANTYWHKSKRHCRACNRVNQATVKARKKAAA